MVKQTGRGGRCQGASWEESIDFWEDEGSFQEDVKFDPEPLGFPEKRREEGLHRHEDNRQRHGVTEKGERGMELFMARTCKEGPRIHAFIAPTERDGNWPKVTDQVLVAEP